MNKVINSDIEYHPFSDVEGFKDKDGNIVGSYDSTKKELKLVNAKYFDPVITVFQDMVKVLQMPGYQELHLPNFFSKMESLDAVFFHNHNFHILPSVLREIPLSIIYAKNDSSKNGTLSKIWSGTLPSSLKWLVLNNNPALTKLPYDIDRLSNLQKLALTGTGLKQLDEKLLDLKKLDLLRTSACKLEKSPNFLSEHENLAYYGDAANTFSTTINDVLQNKGCVDTNEIGWNTLDFTGRVLGESPSSEVFEAIMHDTKQKVAVKIFKNGLSSDGYPQDDMNASIVAGYNDTLIPFIGELVAHPDGKPGIVLGKIDDREYQSLGLPPTFETISRDSFEAGQSFGGSFITQVAKDISRGAGHMHNKGIAHGDLYAHNILSNQQGKSYLGDFGAASLYDPHKEVWREKIDVRAFGYLLEDLLSRCHENTIAVEKLEMLKGLCLLNNVSERPNFVEIGEYLNNI